LVYLRNSRIDAQAGHDGGNVVLDPAAIILDRSQINTSAGHDGGDITLVSNFILAGPSLAESLFHTGASGVDGLLTITSPNADLSGDLIPLELHLLDAESLLKPHCSVRLPQGASSFTVAGRGGWPIEPDGLLPAFSSIP
jgi:hypothetical protein